jgi:hypothetical protein
MDDCHDLDNSLILGRFHMEKKIGKEGRCMKYVVRDVCGG